MKDIFFIIYDYETSDISPETCYALELAALVLDGRTLQEVDGGVFHSYMKPPNILTIDDAYNDPNIKDRALEKNGIKREDIPTFPDEKIVMENFVDFCKKYKTGRTEYDKPIPVIYSDKAEDPISVSFNGLRFDNIITWRLCQQYKLKFPFHKQFFIDMMQESHSWMDSLPDVEGFSFDKMRVYFGMTDLNSEYGEHHTASRDVYDLAMFFRRFQAWKRGLAKKGNFKDSFIKKD